MRLKVQKVEEHVGVKWRVGRRGTAVLMAGVVTLAWSMDAEKRAWTGLAVCWLETHNVAMMF
jgi:hypothetical protein